MKSIGIDFYVQEKDAGWVESTRPSEHTGWTWGEAMKGPHQRWFQVNTHEIQGILSLS